MKLGNGYEGVGSGTVIYSDAQQSIILTCAHIFKEEGRQTPPPSQCRTPITVDLFDGQLSGPRKNQVHYTETRPRRGGRLRPDERRRPDPHPAGPGPAVRRRSCRPTGSRSERMHMITVGCSEGHEATAWDTVILRPKAGLKNTGTGETFHIIECETAPKQGRSGGGLFTDDGYVAGVCDFADPQHGNGLYAVPAVDLRLLDRNQLDGPVRPVGAGRPDSGKAMLANNGQPRRPSGTLAAQSPSEGELTIPPPGASGSSRRSSPQATPPRASRPRLTAGSAPATPRSSRAAATSRSSPRPSPPG